VYGVELLAIAAAHLVNGSGTVASTFTIAGLLGDLLASSGIALVLYQTLLLMREAETFRGLIQLPTDSTNEKRNV
jgi:hypothetical protein